MTEQSLDFEYLLHNIQGGDPRLREALVYTWYAFVREQADLLIEDQDHAEYAIIETFKNAWAQLDQFPTGTNFLAWFTRISVKSIKKYIKTNQKASKLDPKKPDPTVESREAYKAVPLKFRLPATLFLLQDLSVQQISEVLGIRENTVATQIEAGLQLLALESSNPFRFRQGPGHKLTRSALINNDSQTQEVIEFAQDHLAECRDCQSFRNRITAEKEQVQSLFSGPKPEDEEKIAVLLEFLEINDPGQRKLNRISKLGKEVVWVGIAILAFLTIGIVFNEINPLTEIQLALDQAQSDQVTIPIEATAQAYISIAPPDEPAEGGLITGIKSSWDPEISANGRWIVFASDINFPVDADTNNAQDIYVMDLENGNIERVSESTGSGQANNASHDPSISGDGRFVVFSSWADNLDKWDVPRCVVWGLDTSSCPDIFIHDRQSGSTSLISRNSGGSPGDSFSFAPKISANGEKVVYWSAASDLGSGDQRDCGVFQASGPDPISCADIFIYDRRFRSTTRLPIGRRIESYFSTTNIPLDISSDGRWLITNVRATDQIARDLHITSSPSLYLFDLENQEAVAINVAPDGTPGNGPSFDASISADGRFVAFSSQASNLIPDDTNRVIDVFVLDRDTGEVSRISERADGSELSVESGVVHPGRYWTGGGLDISGNGEWVIYTSNSDDLADPSKVDCGFPLNCQNVYITNRLSRQTYQLNYSNVDSLPFTSLTDQGELGVFMAHSPPCDLEEFCSDLYLYNRLVNETYRLGGYGSMPGLASFKPSLRGDSFVHSLHSNRVTSVSFSPDQQMIASGSWDGLVKLVSTETNDQVGTLVGNQRPVNAVEFSPGGELLAAAYEGNEIYIWRQPEQNLAGVLPGFPGVRSLSFSPDEEFLAMGGTGGIWLWYLKDGFLEDTLEIPEGRINALSYSPDGRMLAAASDDNTVWVWKLPDKKLILRLGGHTENVNAVAFSADSSTIASGSNDGTINVWKINKSDIRNLNPVLLYTFDHGDWVTSLDFSRDGRRLVSGSFDSSIAVWDLDDPGMLSLLFDDTQNQILSVEISPDGNQLAAGTVRGEVHFWKDLLLLEEFK